MPGNHADMRAARRAEYISSLPNGAAREKLVKLAASRVAAEQKIVGSKRTDFEQATQRHAAAEKAYAASSSDADWKAVERAQFDVRVAGDALTAAECKLVALQREHLTERANLDIDAVHPANFDATVAPYVEDAVRAFVEFTGKLGAVRVLDAGWPLDVDTAIASAHAAGVPAPRAIGEHSGRRGERAVSATIHEVFKRLGLHVAETIAPRDVSDVGGDPALVCRIADAVAPRK
jgi:hypothetical protein